MTQPDEHEAAMDRLVMDYPVTLERLPDALQDRPATGEPE